jgi:putative colanic acid biosynthesis UDP-glucose lipid carrier transferase
MTDSAFRAPARRLLQNHDTLIVWVQRLLNMAAAIGPLLWLAEWRDGEVKDNYRYLGVVAVLLMFVIYQEVGVYRRYAGPLEGVQKLARAWGVLVMTLGVMAVFTKTADQFSRQVLLVWVLMAFILQAFFYLLTLALFRRIQGREQRVPALVLGTGPLARHLCRSINRNPWLPDRVTGVLSEHAGDISHWDVQGVPVLGTTAEVVRVVQEQGIRRVYAALPLRLTHHVDQIQTELFDCNVDIVWAPDIFSLNLLNHSVREVAGVPLITLSETPLIGGGRAFLKTVMDRVLAVLAVVALSPVMLLIALAIKLDSEGPIFFRQPRHGWDGREFQVLKFRSMVVHQESQGTVTQTQKQDARVTRVGRFIRRTSIDELPQLFNVLEGSMSLVGPRPHAISHNNYYSDKVNAYLARHRIKPGMTGLAQIRGYRGETDSIEKMKMRVECDLEYINQWSLWLDVKILFLTPFALFSRNAY